MDGRIEKAWQLSEEITELFSVLLDTRSFSQTDVCLQKEHYKAYELLRKNESLIKEALQCFVFLEREKEKSYGL